MSLEDLLNQSSEAASSDLTMTKFSEVKTFPFQIWEITCLNNFLPEGNMQHMGKTAGTWMKTLLFTVSEWKR